MKHSARTLLVILLVLSLLPAASFAGGLLPTPKPAQDTVGAKLPNFGSFVGAEGELTAENYEYDGDLWTAWYYPQTDNWTSAVNDYIAACKDRGFSMDISSFNGKYTGYILGRDGLRAVLVPGIDGSILVMAENGLAVDDFSAAEEKTLKIGDVRITYNGKVYECSNSNKLFLNEYGGFYHFNEIVSGEFHWIDFNIPTRVETGTHRRFTSTQHDEDGWYKLVILSGGNAALVDFAPFAARSGLTGPKDYFEVTILYRDKYEVYGVYEGCFNNEKDKIRVEFRLAL